MFYLLFFSVFYVTLCLPCPIFRDSFRIVVLADTHVGASVLQTCSTNGTFNMAVNVQRINEAARIDPNLLFVLILGDIAEGHYWSSRARAALTDLEIPFFPVIGNHDVQVTGPLGSTNFIAAFRDVFEGLERLGYIGQNTMGIPVTPPGRTDTLRFVNYEIHFPELEEEVVFLACDSIHRKNPIAVDPVEDDKHYPEASYHDFPGGTLSWISERIRTLTLSSHVKKIILLHHHPLITYHSTYFDSNPDRERSRMLDPDYVAYAETVKEAAGSHIDKVYGDLVGHFHYSLDHHPFGDTTCEHPPMTGLDDFRELLIDDSKCIPTFAVLQVNLTSQPGEDPFTVVENEFPPLVYCGGHGYCETENSGCTCLDGWLGSTCSLSVEGAISIGVGVGVSVAAIGVLVVVLIVLISCTLCKKNRSKVSSPELREVNDADLEKSQD